MSSNDSILLVLFFGACVSGGLFLARYWRRRSDARLVRERLAAILQDAPVVNVDDLLESAEPQWLDEHEERVPLLGKLAHLIERSGLDITLSQFVSLSAALALLPPFFAFAVAADFLLIAVLVGLALAVVPFAVVYATAEQRRNKFLEQLPDGIELMISVLRGGLSVPQAVKSVGDELPAPCGPEFHQILHRMNLGQTLPDALQPAVDRYGVFELDLIRRATAIQLEVGGSLADLLDKTNATLRQRLQLKRKIAVHTAQSRLSGYVIAALPFFVALAFQIINPSYLKPLYETNVGKVLVLAALTFQIIGMLTIRKLASFRV